MQTVARQWISLFNFGTTFTCLPMNVLTAMSTLPLVKSYKELKISRKQLQNDFMLKLAAISLALFTRTARSAEINATDAYLNAIKF